MARITEITVPSDRTAALVADIRQLPDLVTLRVHTDAALLPPGDIIVVQTTTDTVHLLMQLLDRHGIGRGTEHAIATMQPDSLIGAAVAPALARETSDATWEEMQQTIAFESNMNVTALGMMAFAGVIGTVGLSTNALHLVIAATIIAPGFEPICRTALGIVASTLSGGLAGAIDLAKGYAALIGAGAATALILPALGIDPRSPTDAYYLDAEPLIQYWTGFSASSLLVSGAAGIAGALLIVSHRSMLTAGVLIALSLIPTALATGIGLSAGDLVLAGTAFARFLTDVGLVLVASLGVFVWHRRVAQPRRSML